VCCLTGELFLGARIFGGLMGRCRCLDDVDDEVRDRAAMYLKVINEETLAQSYVKDGPCLVSFDYSRLMVLLLNRGRVFTCGARI
jgi:hypothetical protein